MANNTKEQFGTSHDMDKEFDERHRGRARCSTSEASLCCLETYEIPSVEISEGMVIPMPQVPRLVSELRLKGVAHSSYLTRLKGLPSSQAMD